MALRLGLDKSLEEYKELIINNAIHFTWIVEDEILNKIELNELIDYCSDLLKEEVSKMIRIVRLGDCLDPMRRDHKKIIYNEYLHGDDKNCSSKLQRLVLHIMEKAIDKEIGIIIAKAYESAINEQRKAREYRLPVHR